MTTASAVMRRPVRSRRPIPEMGRLAGVGWVVAAEILSGALGFLAMLILARRLGPDSFASLEYASSVAAWMLVIVRGGIELIVYREAARRHRLIAPLADLLFGLRLLASGIGYTVVLGFAAMAGSERAPAIAAAGLVLFASACVPDVGIRATGRLGWVALVQVIRSVGYLGFSWVLIRGRGDLTMAAFGLAGAESLAAIVTLIPHAKSWGWPRPRVRIRAWRVLIHRGLILSLARFGRVTLYGADMLVLGVCSAESLGPYSAARRVVFALVAIGIVVPSVLLPHLARAWISGVEPTRRLIGQALASLYGLSVPATIGMVLTADRWMPLLFGSEYSEGGCWLALIVVRMPWLLAAVFGQSALVAFRRERLSLRSVLGMLALTVILVPAGTAVAGALGVCAALMFVEQWGALSSMAMLRSLGVLPDRKRQLLPIMAGSFGLWVTCVRMQHQPLATVCVAGTVVYGSIWWLVQRSLQS
jgi:O-antigen/teichoic acid export membrane protein